MIKEAIIKLSKKQDLAYAEAEAVMDEIMSGKATPVQMSAYLTALALKGETIDEITASAAGMRAHCIKLLHDMDVLEIVGTGGDGANSFNISTTSSLVIAAAGVPVAKHGNRAASSRSGAADCLEALGVKIDLEPEKNKEVLEKLQQIPEVVECHYTTGQYDMFIKLYARNNSHLLKIIHTKLQPLGLARTESLISFKEAFKRQLPIEDLEDESED